MEYPVIDMKKTGTRIRTVCKVKGISVRRIQEYMGFSSTQSIYDWFHGKTLPSLDNFFALSKLLRVSMETLIVHDKSNEEIHRLLRKIVDECLYKDRILIKYYNKVNRVA